MGDAKQLPTCRYCGKTYTPLRRSKKEGFCRATHRKSFHKRKKANERKDEKRELAARAGMFMEFDGRTSGQPRDGYGIVTKPRTELKRDALTGQPASDGDTEKLEREKAKERKLAELKEAADRRKKEIPSKQETEPPEPVIPRVDNPSLKQHQRKGIKLSRLKAKPIAERQEAAQAAYVANLQLCEFYFPSKEQTT